MKKIGKPAHWPSLTRVTFALGILLSLTPTVYAQEWGGLANISSTMGVSDSRICVGESSRGDIGCPTYAPFVDAATGYLGIGTAAPSVTLTVSGTTFSNVLTLKSVTGGAVPVSNTVVSGGGGVTTLTGLSDVTLGGLTTGEVLYYNGSSWINQALSGLVSADSITSGTTLVTANTTGYISLTTGGTTTGYFDTAGRLVVPGVSVTTANGISSTNGYFGGKVGVGTNTPVASLDVSGTISATVLQLADNPSTVCGPGTYGTIKFINGRQYTCRP